MNTKATFKLTENVELSLVLQVSVRVPIMGRVEHVPTIQVHFNQWRLQVHN